MKAEGACLAVGEPALERQADGAEGDVLPRYAAFLEQRHFERLFARLEFQAEEARAVEKVHLVHVGHRDHAERLAQRHLRAGFLERLAQSGLGRGFWGLPLTRPPRALA